MKCELIVALDVNTTAQAVAVMKSLPEKVLWYKMGLELFCAEGPRILEAATSLGKNVFLDLKLHDIPRTVERAVKSVAGLGAKMLTIHAAGGRAMIQAAASASAECPGSPRIIAVTLLTSLDAHDLRDLGVGRTSTEQVLAMADLALASGAQGLVSSAQEVKALREKFGPAPLFVTPGIRLPSGDTGDQKRVATPANAVRDGASFLVVGRPILEAPNPAQAAEAILADMLTK